MGILALIAEFENDIRHERQRDGIKKAQERGVRFGRKPLNWIEHYNGTDREQLNETRRVIKRTRSVRPKHRLAILHVERIEATGVLNEMEFWAEHDPIDEPQDKLNPAHSLIKGLDTAEENQWQVLCTSVRLVSFDCEP